MSKLDKVEKCIQKGKEAELIKLSDSKDKELRIAAMKGMGEVGRDDSFNKLITFLPSEDPDIRIAAAIGLGKLRNQHADAHLRYVLQGETNEAVKAALTEALSLLHKEGR